MSGVFFFLIYLAFSLSGEGHCYRFPQLQQALLYRFVVEEVTVHNTGISLLLSTSVWVLLSPPIERRETRTNGLTSLSTDGVAKEGRPKFNPRPGRRLNPGPSGWQSEILPTVPTSHTHDIFTISWEVRVQAATTM